MLTRGQGGSQLGISADGGLSCIPHGQQSVPGPGTGTSAAPRLPGHRAPGRSAWRAPSSLGRALLVLCFGCLQVGLVLREFKI